MYCLSDSSMENNTGNAFVRSKKWDFYICINRQNSSGLFNPFTKLLATEIYNTIHSNVIL